MTSNQAREGSMGRRMAGSHRSLNRTGSLCCFTPTNFDIIWNIVESVIGQRKRGPPSVIVATRGMHPWVAMQEVCTYVRPRPRPV